MSTLETASDSTGLRRIAIDPVSRVEGHGKVTLLVDDDNRVRQARLHVVEFRGFEAFIVGRPYWEVPVVVQRLCGICPVSHHLAAVKAMDRIAGFGPLTATAEKLRRLMHYGQIAQSHAVHFFHLASPDLLLGFDSEATRRNIVGVAAAFPETAMRGVLLRKFGQEIIKATAGKRIHGTGAVPGGMNRSLPVPERDRLRAEADERIAWAVEAVGIVRRLFEASPGYFAGFGSVSSTVVGLVDGDGGLDLYEGGLRARSADGTLLFDQEDVAGYRSLLTEEVKPWSYMKFPHITALGPDDGWYKVGPLARLQVADRLATPLAEAERRAFLATAGGAAIGGALMTHWARLVELVHALEVVRDLLDDPDIVGPHLLADSGPRRGEAVGVIEAPRGTLFHHYRVGPDDLVTWCNLIVSTTNNNQAMNEAIRTVARDAFDGRTITEGLLNHIEVAIRAYDPCLSCATHALGAMPLIVEAVGPDGTVRSSLRRDGS